MDSLLLTSTNLSLTQKPNTTFVSVTVKYSTCEELLRPRLALLRLSAAVITRCRSSKLPLLNYTSCLNMEQILLFCDQPAPQGVRTDPSPTYPHSERGPRDSPRMIYTNKKRPRRPPSQSDACLSTHLVAVKDKLM